MRVRVVEPIQVRVVDFIQVQAGVPILALEEDSTRVLEGGFIQVQVVDFIQVQAEVCTLALIQSLTRVFTHPGPYLLLSFARGE